MNKVYNFLMYCGKISGCHQKKEHSFVIKDKQFPVCARCSGVILGYLIGAFLNIFMLYTVSFEMLILFPLIMLFDWTLQYLKFLKSTNLRRIITGTLCGTVFGNYYIVVIKYILNFLKIL